MKTILVPLDFSENSKNAMDYAILLANKLKMKLLLFHAYHVSVEEVISDSYKIIRNKEINHTPQEVEKELKVWQEAILKSETDLQCDAVFREGDLSEEIARIMEEQEIEFIVMGTKGVSGLKEIFIGSNTAKVIRKVSCPVVAVPEGYQSGEIRKIVFATDYHDSDVVSIRFIVDLAKLFNAEVLVVHMADGELNPKFEGDLLRYFQEQVEQSTTYDKLKFYLQYGKDVYKSFSEFIIEQDADLLAISAKERKLGTSLFNRGVTKKFVEHLKIPVFAFQAFDIGEKGLF
ncbi:MAG TPA: universal stress protein [Bacteroidia bacterium]|jgi:nucleotide-binding universal stress UspA family protein